MWISAGRADELRSGEVRAVSHGRREVVVCRGADGDVHAVASKCPHRGAPLRYGRLQALVVSSAFGEYELEPDTTVLRCPWHAFEFDVRAGCAVADTKFRLQTYPVKEEAGELFVELQ